MYKKLSFVGNSHLCLATLLVVSVGCSGFSTPDINTNGKVEKFEAVAAPENTPVFVCDWSEYPSWSALGVAEEKGYLDGRQGHLGKYEVEWGVDIKLTEADYDTCITMHSGGTADFSCLTSIDSLNPSLGRDTVIVAPTSTSVGADACIVTPELAAKFGGNPNLSDLKGVTTRGLEKTVSHYNHVRNLQLNRLDPTDYPFVQMDPGAAATAMQTNQPNIDSIQVWNPFKLQTLRTREGSVVVYDSTTIPREIIDCLVAGKDSLQRPGGKEAACCILDAFYAVCDDIYGDDEEVANRTVHALGKKFSKLPAADMWICLDETVLYKTADEALALFSDADFQVTTVPTMVKTCVEDLRCTDGENVTVGFDDDSASMNFSTVYLKRVKEARASR